MADTIERVDIYNAIREMLIRKGVFVAVADAAPEIEDPHIVESVEFQGALNTAERFNVIVESVKTAPFDLKPNGRVGATIRGPLIWDKTRRELSLRDNPLEINELLFAKAYAGWNAAVLGPQPIWIPDRAAIEHSNMRQLMNKRGFEDEMQLHEWSVENGLAFLPHMIERLGIKFRQPYTQLVDTTDPTEPRWFVGSIYNITDSIFRWHDPDWDPDRTYLVHRKPDGTLGHVTYREMDAMSSKFANALTSAGARPGDSIALDVTQGVEWVTAVLGAAKAGCPVWCIIDNVTDSDLALRFGNINPQPVLVVADDRSKGPHKTVYESLLAQNVIEELAEKGRSVPGVVVIQGHNEFGKRPLRREGDVLWNTFLEGKGDKFDAIAVSPDHPVVVHFSSGTSMVGNVIKPPKIFAWGLPAVFKTAIDYHIHRDAHPEDVVGWPTSPGWMVSSGVLFGTAFNQCTLALHSGNSTTELGQFVQDAGVTILGTVPPVVRQWVETGCMNKYDWGKVRVLCTSSEPSTPRNQFHALLLLKGLGNEGIGGTEISGGYATGGIFTRNPLFVNAPSRFNMPYCGTRIMFASQDGIRHPFFESFVPSAGPDGEPLFRNGEVLIVMPFGGSRTPPIGASTSWTLLNYGSQHGQMYFGKGAMTEDRFPLRQHGDSFVFDKNGPFQSTGRADNEINSGGIRTMSSTLEMYIRNANIPDIAELAVVGLRPPADSRDNADVVCVCYTRTPDSTTPEETLRGLMKKAIHVAGAHNLAHIHHMMEMERGTLQPAGTKIKHEKLRNIAQARYDASRAGETLPRGQVLGNGTSLKLAPFSAAPE